jgi:hypothetical protein
VPAGKQREQHHLKARFSTFVSPLSVASARGKRSRQAFEARVRGEELSVPRARCPIRNPNSGSDLGTRNSVKYL